MSLFFNIVGVMFLLKDIDFDRSIKKKKIWESEI